MRPFHIFLQAGCNALQPAGEVLIEDARFDVWTLAMDEPMAPLPVDFDTAFDNLGKLERLHIEPDGSFVWAGKVDSQLWQLFGQLTDQGPFLQNVELRGSAPRTEFEQLLGVLEWPDKKLMFQLAQQGVFLDWTGFQRLAWGV